MIDALASLGHYADHLLPIWQALPVEVRGSFYGPGRPSDWWGEPLPARWDTRIPVMVASYADASKAAGHPLVYVEHGAGQTYEGDERSAGFPSYSGGKGLDAVRLFVCPSERVASRWHARYLSADAVAVGSPRLDRWHAKMASAITARTVDDGRPQAQAGPAVVAVTFHWDCPLVPETRSAWDHYVSVIPALVERAERSGFDLLFHAHPRLWPKASRVYAQYGVPMTADLGDVFDRADVLVADNTSAMWEFASLDRPIVLMDAPWYRRDVDHGLRFWRWADAGMRCQEPNRLAGMVGWTVRSISAEPGLLAHTEAVRRAAVADIYAHTDGLAAERAAQAIVGMLEQEGPVGNPYEPTRFRSARQSRTPGEELGARLHRMGATDEETAAFPTTWGSPVRALNHLDDATLRSMLVAARGDSDSPERVG